MNKKVVFCILGNNFSSRFLRSWTDLIHSFPSHGIDWDYTVHYNPEVHMARNEILGGKNQCNSDIKPWDGGRDYDYIMWLDDDVVFKTYDFYKLFEHETDIVSGLYYKQQGPSMDDLPIYFACAGLDNTPLTMMDIEGKTDLIEVKGNGLGFMLVKKGVFEKIGYPWFEPHRVEYEHQGRIKTSFYSEDVTFQMKAAELGIKSYVDPRVILGHEKNVILI